MFTRKCVGFVCKRNPIGFDGGSVVRQIQARDRVLAFGKFHVGFSTESDGKASKLVYEAPLSTAVRLMKGVSVTSCSLTSVGMPILCYAGNETASVVAQWAMCGTIMVFGIGTTSLFHYLFRPYIRRMWLDSTAEDPKFTVETLTLFAQTQVSTFNLSQVKPVEKGSMHPMQSFTANGAPYFIHPEVFEDKKLAENLLGRPLTEGESNYTP